MPPLDYVFLRVLRETRSESDQYQHTPAFSLNINSFVRSRLEIIFNYNGGRLFFPRLTDRRSTFIVLRSLEIIALFRLLLRFRRLPESAALKIKK